MFISGEDRPATIIIKDHYAFVGFGSAWAEGASSVVKVDLERMVKVSGVVTKEGQTWLYTGVSLPPSRSLGRGAVLDAHMHRVTFVSLQGAATKRRGTFVSLQGATKEGQTWLCTGLTLYA